MSDFGNPVPPPPPTGGTPPPDGGYGGPAPSSAGALATWPQRAGGYIVDQLLMLPGWVLYFIGVPKTFSASTTVNGQTNATGGTDGGNTPLLLVGLVLLIGFSAFNRWYLGGTTGQSLGRRVVGVKLVDEVTGQPIGAVKAFVRDIAHLLDSIVCGLPIGWLWPLWDVKRQTWSDKVMKTSVLAVPK